MRAKKNSVEFIAVALHSHTVLWAILGFLLHFIPADRLLRHINQQKNPAFAGFLRGQYWAPSFISFRRINFFA
jgi:hypothetical protein